MADSTSSKVETLQQIWQRIFRRSSIGVNEDFFDLGGDTWLAAELFTEINDKTVVGLPATTICSAPTIAALNAVLDNPRAIGPAVSLKQSTGQSPPIFMLHGIGSSIVDLVPLVRRMHVDLSIYGLEAKGNEGRDAPLDRIEDIAQSFLPAVREVQPHGPYFLVGYSLGGLIALEIAQQMKAQSEEIGLLVMIDSYPDRKFLAFPQYARLVLQLARNRANGRQNAPSIGKRPLVQSGDGQGDSLLAALQRTKDVHYRALHNYRPRFYEGEIKFVRAAIPSRFPADPVPVWSPLVRGLQVETVPGEHITMLSAQVDPLASLLDKYLREVCAAR